MSEQSTPPTPTPNDDQRRLAGYVEVWWDAVEGFLAALDEVPAEEWSTPTDLPGWDIAACAAHVAHLEGILAGQPEESADVGEPAHVTGFLGAYTEIGVVNRRGHRPEQVIAEIRTATAARRAQLAADPPTDPDAHPPSTPGGVPWTWEVLLRNRPLDIWMHEQDVRRAAGRPGGMDSLAARHTTAYLAESLGYILAKKIGAAAGTTAVLAIDGHQPVAFVVNDAGRGERLAAAPVDADVTVRCDRESFIVLAGGRRTTDAVTVAVEGDAGLGRRLLDALATTP